MSLDAIRFITVSGASGGHGTTTVAGALAHFLGAAHRAVDLAPYQWVWGDRPDPTQLTALVFDRGHAPSGLMRVGEQVLVLRGPCSNALRSVAVAKPPIDHLVLIREPWRPLTSVDIEGALGLAPSVEIPFSPRLARLADAGIHRGRPVTLISRPS